MPASFSALVLIVISSIDNFQPRSSAALAASVTAFCSAGVKLVERLLVHEHDVARQPSLGVDIVRQIILRLGVDAGRGRGDHHVDAAGGECRRQVRHFDLRRDGAGQRGDAADHGVVGAEFQTLKIVDRLDLALGVDTLRRPRHGIQQHQPFGIELFFQVRLLRGVEFLRRVIAGGEERDRVDAVDRALRWTASDSSISPIGAVPWRTERLISACLISEPAECTAIFSEPLVALATSAANWLDVLGVEIAVRIGRRHVPFGLRGRSGRNPARKQQPRDTHARKCSLIPP